MANYLAAFASGTPVHLMVGDPSIGGRFFYNESLTGVNFNNVSTPLPDVLASLLKTLDAPAPPALYAGAIPIPAQLPGFARENGLDFLNPAIEPKIWLGNRVTVATHFDMSYNVACVVAGRRRFTLIPPDQLENMYVGPLEFTLAGPPMSMVRLEAPDFEKFPRFRRRVGRGAVRRARARRRAVHSVHVVAPRRVARPIQRAGQLLVG